VLVTHDRDIADRTGRQIYVRDGLIERDTQAVPT
jgi:predicted ABC-type transport system involved in lysophospholipase L1 biosynthesis ATPase subunit